MENKRIYYECGCYIERVSEHKIKCFVTWEAIKNDMQGIFLKKENKRFINDFDFPIGAALTTCGIETTETGVANYFVNNVTHIALHNNSLK